MSEEQDEIKLTNIKKKKSLFADLRDASKSPFSIAKEEQTVKEEKKKRADRIKESLEEYPQDTEDNEFAWLDEFTNVKLKPGKRRCKDSFFGDFSDGEENLTKKKKKKKNKEDKIDYSKQFSTEERLLATMLTDQMNFVTSLQRRLDHMMDTKSTAMGVSKYMTDFIEGLNQARTLSMQLVDKKVGIKKTIADLNMKERKEFGKKDANAEKDMTAYSASVLRQIMGDRQSYVDQGSVPLADNSQVNFEDIDQFPDIDDVMSEITGDNPSDETNTYLKYENSGINIRIIYRGRDNDKLDYDFIAEDRDGNIVEDYPLPIKTALSINTSTGFATDAYGERYPIDFE